MAHKHPEYEQMVVPRLSPEVKDMNGRSTRKLKQSIEALETLLDAPDEPQGGSVKKERDPGLSEDQENDS